MSNPKENVCAICNDPTPNWQYLQVTDGRHPVCHECYKRLTKKLGKPRKSRDVPGQSYFPFYQ